MAAEYRVSRTITAPVETDSGPLAGLISRSIPDMTDSFAESADALKAAAENP